jgi:hypothetical protein
MSVRKFALKRSASGKLLERLDRELNDEQRAAVLAGPIGSCSRPSRTRRLDR